MSMHGQDSIPEARESATATKAAGGTYPQRPQPAPEPAPQLKQPPSREMMKLDRRTKLRVLSAAFVVTALLAAVIYGAFQVGIYGGREAAPTSIATSELTTRGFLEVAVRADGWSEESSTLAVMCILKADGTPVFYHAMKANARDTVEVEAGSYLISFISPVNADGVLYRPSKGQPVEISAGHTTSMATVLTPIAAQDATQDDYLAIITAVQEAIPLGDATLQGDAGAALVSQLWAYAGASPAFAPPPVEYTEPDYNAYDYAYNESAAEDEGDAAWDDSSSSSTEDAEEPEDGEDGEEPSDEEGEGEPEEQGENGQGQDEGTPPEDGSASADAPHHGGAEGDSEEGSQTEE